MSAALETSIDGFDSYSETQIHRFLPDFIEFDGAPAPRVAETVDETGVDAALLIGLTLKLAASVPNFTTEWSSNQLCLPMQMVDEMCWRLKDDKFVEILGENGPFSYRYAVTDRGREQARRLLEISGYVGPAPVSLRSYAAMLQWQIMERPMPKAEDVRAALEALVLPKEALQVTELAVSSGRSLFLFGPPGNGKTSVARMLHNAIGGDLWIPYCLNLDGHAVRIFDPQCHQRVGNTGEGAGKVDGRWVKIRRPLIVAGGEMTIDSLDLSYSPSLRFYEAPLHVKANGGTFVIDDFGRQRVDPSELLNRWIIPLEHQIDHLTLQTGQKVEVPFKLMLVVATNLQVSAVADPAFLRRMGYRVHLDKPTPQSYALIFQRYAESVAVPASQELISHVLNRYQAENRELRCCEPRDLIERARDICRLRDMELTIDREVLDLAWTGYFGNF